MINRAITPQEISSLFNYSVDELDSLVNCYIDTMQSSVHAIETVRSLTYENTFQAFDKLFLTDFIIFKNILMVLEMVHPEETMRNKAHQMNQKMVSFFITNVASNRKLYDTLMRFMAGADLKLLTSEQNYFIKNTILEFERDGLHLDEEKRNVIEGLKKDIAEASMSFERAIAEDKTILLIDKSDLQGVPDFFIQSLLQENSDLCQIRLDYPTVETILKSCTNQNVRKQIYCSFNNRAYPENDLHLRTLVNKRQELAELLGYQYFIDYDLVDQMAQKFETVDRFLTDLFIKSQKKGNAEFDLLYQLASEYRLDLAEDGKLHPWDIAFLKEKYKEKNGLPDDQAIADYFPFEHTIQGLFKIYQYLFSIEFKQVSIDGLWDTNVRCIQVYTDGGELLGNLLIDLFPRIGKYSHACHIDLIPACFVDGKRQVGLSVVLANFSPAVGQRPSLLKLSEVKTFFHEFGHALHALLGATKIISLSGTNTKLDFVELPSQLLEEWLSDFDVLKKLSFHFQTGASLPDAVIKKIIELKNFDAASFVQRQIYLSRLALRIHAAEPHESFAIIARNLYQQYMRNIAWIDDLHMYCSFGHLGGYRSRYYSYLWSKVFAADIFQVFKRNGLENRYTGKLYVDTILKPGGTHDPNVMLYNFLGRQPTVEAFFRILDL